jgi:hypothetical protein
MGKLPNGWPQPTFMSVDDGGALNIEWLWSGERILFVWDPAEGAMTCHTTRDGQEAKEGSEAAVFLSALLSAMV